MLLDLCGKWNLFYHPACDEMGEYTTWPKIEAQVPGNVELDLWHAGIEPDPFFGTNIYKYRKYEFYNWNLTRTFTLDKEPTERTDLVLEGVNTFAEVFINDISIGKTDNMLIAFRLDASKALKAGENTIRVAIDSAFHHTKDEPLPVWVTAHDHVIEYSRQRKAPSCFSWDIMGRFTSAGLWRGIHLETVKPTRITQAYYSTEKLERDHARLFFSWRVALHDWMPENYKIRLTIGETVYETPVLDRGGNAFIRVDNPRLWWPRNYGEQNLYTAHLELWHGEELVDVREDTIGIRKLKVEQKMALNDAGEFRILCNGVPILAKGSNWVPLDALHSRDAERYEQALALFAEAQCNIVRCWGGNVYEDTKFFDLCDELGIMVWQDFTMAGIAYPQDRAFMDALEKEATAVVCKVRNHASLLLWAGDNECDEKLTSFDYPDKYNPITRELLPSVVRMNDPYRMFLPSSPYITDEVGRYQGPEQHIWGVRAYFKDDFYKNPTAHFISECGYHGCPSPESLKKYIPQEHLWPYNNDSWETHSTDYQPYGGRESSRNKLMANQVKLLFGSIPEDLETFSLLSQVVQAEAKKFFIERTRMHKWRRTGIIWWNMLDGWPQISDAVVDYYFDKKRAFSYICRIQQKICLMVDEPVGWEHSLILGNDSREDFTVKWKVTDADSGEVLAEGTDFSPANENVTLRKLPIPPAQQRLLLLTWEAGGKRYGNHFISGFPAYDPEKMKKWLKIIDTLPCGEMID